MSTQQDIYAAGFENRPHMLNKENYVPWSSCLLRYAKSRPNGKLIYNSIINGPYVRRMIPEPCDAARAFPNILLGLPEDIYAVVDSYETAKEIWLRVQQMMKGSNIGIQEKKAKLFNKWERFTSTDRESIDSYYHRFSKLMNDFKRNKHFPEKIASNLKFLNNLQPKWSRHVTILHQTKDLHTADYTQLYDFLKYNQKEVDELRAERLAKTHDPLELMANSNNPFNYPVFYLDQLLPNPTTAINMGLVLMITQPGMNMGQDRHIQMVESNGGNQFRQYARQNVGNKNGYNAVQTVGNQVVQNAVQNPGVRNVGNQNGLIIIPGIANQTPNGNGNVVEAWAQGNTIGNNGNQIRCYNCRGLGHLARNCIVRPQRRDAAYLQTKLLITQKEEVGIQLQAKEFDLMAAAADLDEIKEVNANCILMANLQQASTSGTQTDKALVYDSDRSTKNDSNVISEVFSMEQSGGTVDQHSATVKETCAYHESLFHNLAAEVEKSVYQEQCLTKKINALHLSSDKQITALNEEISNLNKQLSKEKAIVSSLQEEKKRLKSNFKIREDEFLDKQIQLENKIKKLDNILVKTEADESLAKHKVLELEIERLLRAVVSQDIMSIVQKPLEYMNIHDNDASENSQPTWGKMCTSGYHVNFQGEVVYTTSLTMTAVVMYSAKLEEEQMLISRMHPRMNIHQALMTRSSSRWMVGLGGKLLIQKTSTKRISKKKAFQDIGA
ncbi:retrovirus-related pol polyprotein from transposon TNT 1-94 [Tanacetum coccineum]